MTNTKNSPSPLAFIVYYTPVLLFVLTGLVSSSYLLFVHYKNYTDITYSSICAISQAINCDTVAQSDYSILFSVPLAFWGTLSFLFYLFLIILGRTKDKYPIWIFIFLFGLLCSLVSIYLGYISAVEIESYCIFCLTCYLCHFGISFYAFIIHQRFKITYTSATITKAYNILTSTWINKTICSVFITIIITGPFTYPHYWEFSTTNHFSPDISTGITENGNPWIGAQEPKLEITIYSDYQCFQCYKMHALLSNLVSQHPQQLRLIHVQFPLDHKYNPAIVRQSYHVGSGVLALIGIQAANQGKFWQVNEKLYRIGRNKGELDIKEFAKSNKLDPQKLIQVQHDPQAIIQLRKDMTKGIEMSINSTPSFEINGNIFRGTIPLEIFQKYNIH